MAMWIINHVQGGHNINVSENLQEWHMTSGTGFIIVTDNEQQHARAFCCVKKDKAGYVAKCADLDAKMRRQLDRLKGNVTIFLYGPNDDTWSMNMLTGEIAWVFQVPPPPPKALSPAYGSPPSEGSGPPLGGPPPGLTLCSPAMPAGTAPAPPNFGALQLRPPCDTCPPQGPPPQPVAQKRSQPWPPAAPSPKPAALKLSPSGPLPDPITLSSSSGLVSSSEEVAKDVPDPITLPSGPVPGAITSLSSSAIKQVVAQLKREAEHE